MSHIPTEFRLDEEQSSSELPALKNGRIFAYSNRPPVTFKGDKIVPNMSGGAARVILDAGTQCWIGPGRAMPRAEYDALPDNEKYPTKPVIIKENGRVLRMYLFPYPEDEQEEHYDFSNTKIWPKLHSTDPLIFTDPVAAMKRPNAPDHYVFNYDLKNCTEGWQKYKQFNARANEYIRRLRIAGELREEDVLIIHDYQCASVEGDLMTFHTPQSSVDFLDRVRIPRGDKSGSYVPFLGEEGYWQDFLHEVVSKHKKGIIFQRPIDQQNFFEQLAAISPHFRSDNATLFEREYGEWKAIPQPLGGSSAAEITIRETDGKPPITLKTMNIPVGTSQEADVKEAELYAPLFELDKFGRPPANLTVKAHHFDKKEGKADPFERGEILLPLGAPRTIPSMLRPALQPGHHIILNAHRDDPSKNAMAQLDAIEIFFRENPKALGSWHAVLFLPDSRATIPAYENYGEAVLKHAATVRKNIRAIAREHHIDLTGKGEPLITFPENIPHEELMGLEHHKNVGIKIEGAPFDGHALTAREPFNVRARWSEEKLKAHPLAVVAALGVGASDITKGNDISAGMFTFPPYQHHQSYAKAMAGAIGEVYQHFQTASGREKLMERYKVGRDASAYYTGTNYGREIVELAESQRIGDLYFLGGKGNPSTRVSEPALYGIEAQKIPLGDSRPVKLNKKPHRRDEGEYADDKPHKGHIVKNVTTLPGHAR